MPLWWQATQLNMVSGQNNDADRCLVVNKQPWLIFPIFSFSVFTESSIAIVGSQILFVAHRFLVPWYMWLHGSDFRFLLSDTFKFILLIFRPVRSESSLSAWRKLGSMVHVVTWFWLPFSSIRHFQVYSAYLPPSLIIVFAVRMKKAWALSCPLSAQQRLWSDWGDAQADLSLCSAHTHFVGFVMSRLSSLFLPLSSTDTIDDGLTWFFSRDLVMVPRHSPLYFLHNQTWATSRETVSLGIFDQVRFKPAYSAKEKNMNLGTLNRASIHIILSK